MTTQHRDAIAAAGARLDTVYLSIALPRPEVAAIQVLASAGLRLVSLDHVPVGPDRHHHDMRGLFAVA